MCAVLVSDSFEPPYFQRKQAIKEFIRRTQVDYFNTRIKVAFLIDDTLQSSDSPDFNQTEFQAVYDIVQDMIAYCEANGIRFADTEFHAERLLTVVIYDEKKQPKEAKKHNKEPKHKNVVLNFFSQFFSSNLVKGDDRYYETQQESQPKNQNTSFRKPNSNSNQEHSSNNTNDKNHATPQPSPSDAPFNAQTSDYVERTDVNATASEALKFDALLAECIRGQINEISSRLVKLNELAEDAGYRVMCKLKHIGIQPMQNDAEIANQLSEFLVLYGRDRVKVLFLKQILDTIDPVVANFFDVQEVKITAEPLPEVPIEKTNPFEKLYKDAETNVKVIADKWHIELIYSYFEQNFDAIADTANVSQFKAVAAEQEVASLDLQMSIQDHHNQDNNPRVITAPSRRFVIGRSDDVQVQLFGDTEAGPPKFSRHHLEIQKTGNQWMVTCLSESPVLVDGTDVLRHKDAMLIKNAMSFRLGTSQGIGTGEYGIYPEITFHITSKTFAAEITDPTVLNA